ncbi:MAG: GNAT family N-acetyltransferase [Brevinema sp.]
MIRRFSVADTDVTMNIWLETNTQTHSFIPRLYWESHYDEVKSLLPHAEITVYEEKLQVLGFIGAHENNILGIFVKKEHQSQRIGKKLLDFLKQNHHTLKLNVYQKNEKALKFYLRENFVISGEQIDSATSEKEWIMVWKN